MRFQAKSTIAIFAILAAVYGWYFATMLTAARHTPINEIIYQPLMILVTIPLVLLMIVVHVAIAITAPGEAGVSDERDRLIALRGGEIGRLVLATGVFGSLVLAMFGGQRFWIAHTLLGALVLAEMAAAATKLVLYRRGG